MAGLRVRGTRHQCVELDFQEQAYRKGLLMAFRSLLGSGASVLGAQNLLDHLGMRMGLANSSVHFRAGVATFLYFGLYVP